MNARLKKSVLVLYALAIPVLAHAVQGYGCPDKVRLMSGSVAPDDVPSGFQAMVPASQLRLSGVSVFDGPPEESAVLKPSSVTARGTVIKWQLDGLQDRGAWISCDYANGLVHVATRAGQVAACTATLAKVGEPKALTANFVCD